MQVIHSEPIAVRRPATTGGKSKAGQAMTVLTLVVVAATCAYVLTTLLWGLNRVFDTTDEGYYLLSGLRPQEYESPISFHYLLPFVPTFTASRVMDLRYAQVLAQLAGGALLSVGYIGWLKRAGLIQGKLALSAAFVFSTMGNLLLFSKFPLSLSYNSLAGLFVFSATGLLLIAGLLERNSKSGSLLQTLAITFAGACTGLTLFAKFSSAFALLPIAALLVATLCPQRRFRNLLALTAGVVFTVAIYFTQIQSFQSWLQPILDWLLFVQAWRTKHNAILPMYWESTLDIAKYFHPWLSIALGSAFLAPFTLSKLKPRIPIGRWKVIGAVLNVVLWSAVSWWLIGKDCLHHDMYKDCVFFVLALVAACECAGYYAGSYEYIPGSAKPWRLWLATAAVALAPLASSFGTGNCLLYQCSIYLSGTFAFTIACALVSARQLQLKLPVLSTVTAFCIFTAFQLTDGYVYHTYSAQPQTLHEQVQETGLRPLAGIRVTPDQARFFNELNTCLRANGFQSGDTILGLHNMPGVVYALDAKSAQLSWFMKFENSGHYNARYLRKVTVPANGRLFVLLGFKLEPEVAAALAESEIGFPQNFRKVGVVKSPFDLKRADMQWLKQYLYEEAAVYVYDKRFRSR